MTDQTIVTFFAHEDEARTERAFRVVAKASWAITSIVEGASGHTFQQHFAP